MEDRPGSGKLLVCATPIGNLEDITLRVLKVLQTADLIAAEDTRHTRKLLSAYDIHVPLTAYHQHNRKTKGVVLLAKIATGSQVALVSDAGLPGISDPGEELIRECIGQGLPVEVLPGATASLTALVLSGLPTERFVFEGFLPRRKKDYRQRLQQLAGEERTIILYEAPHRLAATLAELTIVLGADRPAAFARELTKKFETIRRGTLGELTAVVEAGVKGECTLVIAGKKEQASPQEDDIDELLAQELARLAVAGLDSKVALKTAARNLGITKREAYRLKIFLEKRED
ncbi:MAG: 16S rRNA (cytidine(1402)-2'-O)-methyltransferase [Heliobacteriaceae bacterium]|nr:16S rRNA (cytidine(1402)-2'-O)-methyltransferase [Heliobacteriaceae bacterium]